MMWRLMSYIIVCKYQKSVFDTRDWWWWICQRWTWPFASGSFVSVFFCVLWTLDVQLCFNHIYLSLWSSCCSKVFDWFSSFSKSPYHFYLVLLFLFQNAFKADAWMFPCAAWHPSLSGSKAVSGLLMHISTRTIPAALVWFAWYKGWLWKCYRCKL